MSNDVIECNIFCDVIDNFGDAGVCWRLARDISVQKNWKVRLFINNLHTLHAIGGCKNPLLPRQENMSIEILDWSLAQTEEPGEVVIETFGCRIPAEFEEKIAKRKKSPVWINLEYLSAEDWVEGCHCLPSPHPQYGTKKYFFFPGVTSKTGGLIIEKNLSVDKASFLSKKKEFFESLGLDPDAQFNLFVFCYPQSPIDLLAKALEEDGRPTQILLAAGKAGENLAALVKDIPFIRTGTLPMCPQPDFDQYLWAADSAIVRGEDSFARAQICGLPFIWNIYPQTEQTHIVKLKAFAKRLEGYYSPEDLALWTDINLAFNNSSNDLIPLWKRWRDSTDSMRESAQIWTKKLYSLGSLTENLCNFIEYKLES